MLGNFLFSKNVGNSQQCFSFTPQPNFSSQNLNSLKVKVMGSKPGHFLKSFYFNLTGFFWEEMTKQYHLRRTTFIRTKYLTFQNFKTISNGFGKIKDQKMEITFTLIRKFTVCTMAKTELLYLKNMGA